MFGKKNVPKSTRSISFLFEQPNAGAAVAGHVNAGESQLSGMLGGLLEELVLACHGQ